MKKYKLINLRKGSILAFSITALFLGSCTTSFEKINTDLDKVATDDLNKDNLWGAYIQSMQLSVMVEDANSFQLIDDLCGNIFSGYASGTENWGQGSNSTTYTFNNSLKWHDRAFAAAYGSLTGEGEPPVPGVMNSWNIMRQKVDSSSVVFAVGEIVKVQAMHRVTDMYGPIPYVNYGQTLYTAYDSQKDVYQRFFKELDHAIGVLSEFYGQNAAARPIASFDIVYNSDLLKWIKFANSLKLRLAMRTRYIDPVNAHKYAGEAVNHKYGVIEDNTGSAAVKSSSLYPFKNPYPMIVSNYNDTRMGANMESFLSGYSDPRLSVYFSQGTNNKYSGVRLGVGNNASAYEDCAVSNIGRETVPGVSNALYWMQAAEVYFLRAEGAILGWTDMNGSAGDLYNKGIITAMDLWKISGKIVTDYTNNADAQPAAFVDSHNAARSIAKGDPKLSTITIKWTESDSYERKLERIITQKWLAMYPNGQEAWSEFRRTGYPKVFPVVNNNSGGKVAPGSFIKRIPLPVSEHQNNAELTQKAVAEFLTGDDSPGVKLWWDAK